MKYIIAILLFVSVSALANQPAKMENGILTDPKGMTLYTFDKDHEGMSMCTGECETNWPPFLATASDKNEGDYTVINREGGKKQWSYKGKPLYHWKNDKKAGDKTGDGVKGVWHIIK